MSIIASAAHQPSLNRKANLFTYTSRLKYNFTSKRYPWFSSFGFGYEVKTNNENKASVEYNNTYELLVGMNY